MRPLVPLLVGLLLAGCAAPAPEPEEPSPSRDAAPGGYAYACPPGETFERAPGVCAGTLEDLENGLDEPYVAIDPRDSAHLVIVAHSTGAQPVASDLGIETLMTAAYFTEDGGATWQRSELPRVDIPSAFGPVEARLYYDPAAAWAPDGALHYVGMASNDAGAAGMASFGARNVPYWTATDDDGATWREPVVLDERFSDRTFLAVEPTGRIVAIWAVYTEEGDVRAALAWSRDAGATWTEPVDTDCRGFSPPRVLGERAHVVCVTGDDVYPDRARLLRVDDAELTAVGIIGELPGYRARLGVLPDGGLAVANHARDILLTASFDGGATWTAPVNVLGATSVDDAHPAAWLKWSDADPWGGVHVVLGLSDNDACGAGSRGAPGTCRVAHAVLDPADGRLLHEAVLSEADGARAYRAPGSLAPPGETLLGDDFYAFDFADDLGVLLWTRDGGIDHTRVVRSDQGNMSSTSAR